MIERLDAALRGRYRIERQLGEGGMATVFLAHDERHDRKVAIKVFRPELAAMVGVERFLAEIKTTANLQHPHILPLHDSGEAEGFLFYVMPYVEGESLRDRLDREKQLPVGEAVGLVAKVAGALELAHRQGVIHRDIKPANILLSNGEPLVADFGVALAVQQAGGGRLTETGLSLGTPYYMSPEQATADRDPDARSDVYSLGCVLYETLTGEPPFQGATAQAVVGRILTAEVEPPSLRRRSVPPRVEAVVLTALEKLPADRFHSAAEFAEALANPALATTRTHRRRELAAGPGGLSGLTRFMGVAILLLAALAAWGWLRPLPEERVSRYTLEASGRALPGDRWFSVAVTPDGSGVVYAAESEGRAGLWHRRLDRLEAVFVDGTEEGINPTVSPDGSRVAFVAPSGGNRALRVTTLSGGGTFTVTDSLVDFGGVGWGDDGYIYYDGHLEGDGIARVPERGGEPEVVTVSDVEAGELWHMDPHPLPDARGLLFSIARGNVLTGRDFRIGVVDGAGVEHRILVEEGHSPLYAGGHLLFVREGRLMAAPFDLRSLQISGRPTPIFHGIEVRSLGRSDLSASPNGTLAYVAGDTSSAYAELVWMDRSAVAERVDPTFNGTFDHIALSPDGRTAAVSRLEDDEYQLWTMDLTGGGARRLTFEGNAVQPEWTPDGREIVFVSQATGSLETSLKQVPADGRTLPRTILETGTRSTLLFTPSYSPDGEWIVYSRAPDASAERRDLVSRRTGPGGEEISLQEGPAFYGDGRVSPGGRWIAYVSDETGRSEVYVRPFPDAGRAKALVSRSGGLFPRWSPDGSELFYVTPTQDLMSARVLDGEGFRTDPPVRLFSRAELGVTEDLFYEVDPEGDRFLMVALSEEHTEDSRLVVVENFLRELREGTRR